MLSINIHITYIVVMATILEINSLLKLSTNEDKNRNIAEIIAQDTVNKLFTSLKVKDGNWHRALHDVFKAHNHFNPIDATYNIKDVIEVSRVNNIDNRIQNNIIKINEAFRENDKNGEANDTSTVVVEYIETVIRKLRNVKEKYETKIKKIRNNTLFNNNHDITTTYIDTIETSQEDSHNENIFNHTEFWRPSARRIYRGLRTRIKHFPFVASVQFFMKYQCAGSIIKSDLVITSASCLQLAWNNRFFRENPAYLSVRVGSDYYEHGGESIDVQEIYFYPSYDPKTLRNNLAIMRLVRRLKFGNQKRIKKIDIDRAAHPLPENTGYITVLGWGARDSSNIVYDIQKNRLAYANLGFYPLDECQEQYGRDYVTKKNFCGGFFSRGAGACNRDAGGPAIVDYTLTGVISFGSPICGSPDKPTVMTKLGYYADWIDDIIAQDVPSTYKKTTTLSPYIFTIAEVTTPKKIRFTPMMDTTRQPTIPAYDVLRLLKEEVSNDFFTSEEIRQIHEMYDSDSQKNKQQRLGPNMDIPQNKQLDLETQAATVAKVNGHSVKTIENLTAVATIKITQQPYNEEENSNESSKSDVDLVNDPPVESEIKLAQDQMSNFTTYDELIETAITAINIPLSQNKDKLIPQQLNDSKNENNGQIFETVMKPIQRKQNTSTDDLLLTKTNLKNIKQQKFDNSGKLYKVKKKKHTSVTLPIANKKPDGKVKTQMMKDTIKALMDDLDLDNILKDVDSLNDNIFKNKTKSSKKNTTNSMSSSDEDEIGLSLPSDLFNNNISAEELPESIEYNKIPKHILFNLVSVAVEEELKKQATAKRINRKGKPYLI